MAAGLTRTANSNGRLLPGLHRLDVERDWLLHDAATFPTDQGLKLQALAERREQTLRVAPGADTLPAQLEVLEMVLAYLPRRYPESYVLRDGTVTVAATGQTYLVEAWREAPLELAGLLLQEDLVLMHADAPGVHRIQAGFVVFSFGRVLERVGMDLQEVHANVNRFDKDLQRPVTRFFDRVAVESPSWRTNFGLTWSPSLVPSPDRYPHRASFAPEATLNTPAKWMMHRIRERGVARSVWLKVEYQTFRRLPLNPAFVLFTVRTYVEPFTSLAHVPAAAHALAANMRDCAKDDFARYLGIDNDEVREAVLGYLDAL